MKVNAPFDRPPPLLLCPPGWVAVDLDCRQGAMIAADYWEQLGSQDYAEWLREWAELSPDKEEARERRNTDCVYGWGRSRGFGKTQRSRRERRVARGQPGIQPGYVTGGLS